MVHTIGCKATLEDRLDNRSMLCPEMILNCDPVSVGSRVGTLNALQDLSAQKDECTDFGSPGSEVLGLGMEDGFCISDVCVDPWFHRSKDGSVGSAKSPIL